MRNKLFILLIILILGVFGGIVAILASTELARIDMIALNEIRTEVENNTEDFSQINITEYEVIVINFDGVVLYSSNTAQNKTYEHWINFALQNDKIILEFTEGRIFVTRPNENGMTVAIVLISVLIAIIVLSLISYGLYLQKSIHKPFKTLKKFATEIAKGNLDSPLLMDRENAFGAFSESFDILRLELKTAKEKEIELEKSKKELIAQLSHDIKTPIASIKAVSELLLIEKQSAKTTEKLDIITNKANEIDTLITNMFSISLDDLSQLKVNPVDVPSSHIENAIAQADYLGKIKKIKLPECLVKTDPLRLDQIIGNILNNSYKYANTEIIVKGEVAENDFSIEFADFGNGVEENELPLIMGKFFRGSNNADKEGAGLGLYICKSLLEKMNGKIDCYNTESGFSVKIFLPLS
ncbi:MAG: HAMP domain-containing histidine kinase [Firmicutes bacterium]|nr:HAMP domain-containing histidine kinase [Bacillota bacterium]